VKTPAEIAPARGKLGILLVGLGAVSTTVIAGVHAIRKKLAPPVGSLTEMGTIRLGKRTDGRSPRIREFVDLAVLDDIVFGGWDIFQEDCYAAARTAGVLESSLLDQVWTNCAGETLSRGRNTTVGIPAAAPYAASAAEVSPVDAQATASMGSPLAII
jgi:hypothetical protein